MKLISLIKSWFKPRYIFINREKMTKEEITSALAVSDQHPLWRAIQQLLQDHIDDAIDLTVMPETAVKANLLVHTAGGLEALKTFQEDLLERKLKEEIK